MIAYLHGVLNTKNTQQLIIDVHGIGYEVFIPLSTFYKLPEPCHEVHLFIYTHVRESVWQLFGFWTQEERDLFEIMLGVSKIGPKLARNILSHISIEGFKSAILTSDVERIKAIPGVGEKTARRIILELKDKLPPKTADSGGRVDGKQATPTSGSAAAAATPSAPARIQDDAISALVSLGYSRLPAERAVNQTLQREADLSIEELIKKALHRLS